MIKELVKSEDLIAFLAKSASITKVQAKSALNAFYECLYDCMKQKKSIRIPKIGTFSVVKTKPRKYAGFKSGKVIEQGEIDRLKFTPSSIIKNDLKSSS